MITETDIFTLDFVSINKMQTKAKNFS